MKVKELIAELQKQNPEREVYIQQGEEYDYTTVHTVKEKELWDIECLEDDDTVRAVVIEYT